MKKLLILLAFSSALTGYAQKEAFFQTVDDLEYTSNRSTAIMVFAEKHPEYKIVTGGPQVLDSTYLIIENVRTIVAYEILEFISPSENLLIQLAFVNDQLYAKNIAILYPQDAVKEANDRYDSLNVRLMDSHRMKYFRNGGDLSTIDKDVPAGRTRIYPIKRVDGNILAIKTGVLYNIEDVEQLAGLSESKGIWVFVTIYETFSVPINLNNHFPGLIPPYMTIEELSSKQATAPETYSSDAIDDAAEIRKAELDAIAKEKEEAAAAAEEGNEKDSKKKKKKNKKEKEDKEEKE